MPKTGELAVFFDIWQERTHFCQNNECNERLHRFREAHFHHLITKGSDPARRLDKEIIIMLCWDCHRKAEQEGNSALNLPPEFREAIN